MTSGTVSAVLTQKRRVMSVSSGLSSSSVMVRGSSAMPQIGQLPGASRTISGCIGQVHSVFVAGAVTISGSSAMPHFGQAPGLSCRTSGSIGQTYTASTGAKVLPAGADFGSGRSPRVYAAGFASNFVLQLGLQK